MTYFCGQDNSSRDNDMAGLAKVRRDEFPGKIPALAGSRRRIDESGRLKGEEREIEKRGCGDTLILHIVLITEGRFVQQCLSG